jgi:hypothetical protein
MHRTTIICISFSSVCATLKLQEARALATYKTKGSASFKKG